MSEHRPLLVGAGSDERRGPEAPVQLVRDGHAPFDGLALMGRLGALRPG